FAANDTAGSGDDGASAVFDVRLGGAAADAAPVYSGNATLLSHANYPAGCYEIEIPATEENGFAEGETYGVFCTLAVDGQNPSGHIGSFQISAPLSAESLAEALGSLTDLTSFPDGSLAKTIGTNLDAAVSS